MKKGHRRTNSETIGLSRPFQPKIEKVLENQQLLFQPKFEPQIMNPTNEVYPSIQSLLEKSENHIAQRVLYIENLQQPNITQNNNNQFSFGKGVNYKLSNFKLNMGEIPQVPKSNQSTSLQGQNKIEILQKQLYFAPQPLQNLPHTQDLPLKQHQKIVKFIPKHLKTSSAVGMKKIIKIQKNQKLQLKNEIKSFHEIILKDYPLKKPKIDLQVPKKLPSSIKDQNEGIPNGPKVGKQTLVDRFGVGVHKKKKNTWLK